MLSKYISGAAVAFLAYDITDRASFADVDDWLKMVRGAFTDKYTGDRLKMPRTYLLGNKIDLMTQCQVPELYHKQLIDRESLDGGFRVSAKSGEKLVASFCACPLASRRPRRAPLTPLLPPSPPLSQTRPPERRWV